MTKFTVCYPCNLPFLVSQKWGENHDYYYTNFKENGHNGWDFAVPIGTPIYATHDGQVFFVGIDSTGANTISIDSGVYDDGQYRTIYGHLSLFKVEEGDKVKRGDLIGLSGNTGRYTTGPHLHYGIHPIANFQDTQKNNGWNGAVDPIHYFDGTYPNTITMTSTTAVQPIFTPPATPFSIFQKALRDFQVSEGIKPFELVGPQTKRALNKYLINNKY